MTGLDLTRGQILAFRRRVGALDQRLASGASSLRRVAWAGLQDSVPRAALLSIHARVREASPAVWAHESLVQVWGPRFSAYVVPEQDRAVFTVGRLPVDPVRRQFAEGLADRLEGFLDGRRLSYRDAGQALGVDPNQLRYAAPTGRVLLRWEGAGRPQVWTVARPDTDPDEARLELARRYLHVFAPGTLQGFEKWAGLASGHAGPTFDALGDSLVPVRTPLGQGWILAQDEQDLRQPPTEPAVARLLPSGDTYYLLWGADRRLLVSDPARQAQLWTSRVWPGALLVDGEIVGIWRRAAHTVTITLWTGLPANSRQAVEAEAAALPLPDLDRAITVRWDD
ncbi:DNA glycosylase AlkZ-like family protein [Ornithinicoccus halotolerans]|uniref:DNA glycosylase AlkZ-like family protein n=1 Tax=Ornithinicoccus halotolerans TaxID=1748220 RepID=UPI0012966A8D|nr:crosslink repair DNA glycosylase YcaQ family protein [Ornithinicoccus halotolerans]